MQIKHIDQFGSTAGDDVVLSEKGIGFSGVIDLLTNRAFGLRGTVDYDSFKGASSDNSLYCPSFSQSQCDVNLSYVTLGVFSRINFNQSLFQYWVALGINLKYPISKKATALAEGDIGTTSSYSIVFGSDFSISQNFFVPISIEQQNFLNSDSVRTEMTLLKIGLGKFF